MKNTILSLFILLILACNNPTKSDETYPVEEKLDALKEAFNIRDIDAIMQLYHRDFLHKGESRLGERIIWENRLGTYTDMNIENVTVDVDGRKATASFTLKLYSPEADYSFNEPEELGDMSYFIRENGDWYLYGNQNYSK